jgi:hypothetical protein
LIAKPKRSREQANPKGIPAQSPERVNKLIFHSLLPEVIVYRQGRRQKIATGDCFEHATLKPTNAYRDCPAGDFLILGHFGCLFLSLGLSF